MSMRILCFLVLALLLLFLCGGLYAYRRAFYAPKKKRQMGLDFHGMHIEPYQDTVRGLFDELAGRPCEELTILSRDGRKLHGWYYEGEEDAPLDIFFHGYRSFCMKDFCGGAELSRLLGHKILLVDQRAHGKSEGHTISFGVKERFDVVSWANYGAARFGEEIPIMLYGISMGGTTVLMASELELPKNVKGIVADCPFDTPMNILTHVAQRTGIPKLLLRPFLILGAGIFGGFYVYGADAAQAVKKASVPILIIHGEADTFVPCEMSKTIYSANPSNITLVTVPDAHHGISYLVDPEKYQRAIMDFIKKCV